jgi:hypothetical protein
VIFLKKILLALIFVVMLQSLFIGIAGAEYVGKNDIVISINTGQNLYVPLNTGEASFNLQESVHNELTQSSGVEVDHYYIWLEVDGQRVLAIDPAKFMY